jgi:hypothetical protein
MSLVKILKQVQEAVVLMQSMVSTTVYKGGIRFASSKIMKTREVKESAKQHDRKAKDKFRMQIF